MDKAELRKIYLARRKALTVEERNALSRQIAENFFDKSDLNKVRFFHCFLSIERLAEVDTAPIIRRLWRDFPGVKTVVPRVNRKIGEIESLTYSENDELLSGAWHIDEPAHHERVEPGEIDLVLVPLVCFDRGGQRVGYGKGFYDRFLVRCRPGCLKIGLSFFEPVDAIANTHPGDIRLDFCVTPDRLYAMQGSNGV